MRSPISWTAFQGSGQPAHGRALSRTSRVQREQDCLDTPPAVRRYLPFVKTYRADDAWDTLGDQSRRAIVACLAERPRAVRELANELPISRPAVSQHLKVLKDAGLVTERAAGTRRIYRLNPVGVAALRDQLDTFWIRALAAYKDIVEESREESS